MSYTVGSLFSGIGGIDLAFSRAGFDIRWQVEIEPFCQKILAKHAPSYWPNAKVFNDVRTVGQHNLSSVDVIAGGFPCQDISAAGKGAGIKEGTRSGLWFEFARIIGELRPRYVFIENVPAITTNGGTTVLADLAALGYDARWGVVAASSVGAPHRRERWFCVANTGRAGSDQANAGNCSHRTARRQITENIQHGGRLLPTIGVCSALAQSRLGGIFNGLPARLDTARRQARWPAPPGQPQHEWEAPRTCQGAPNRTARLKALGNSVVPQVIQPFAEGLRQALEADDLGGE